MDKACLKSQRAIKGRTHKCAINLFYDSVKSCFVNSLIGSVLRVYRSWLVTATRKGPERIAISCRSVLKDKILAILDKEPVKTIIILVSFTE